MDSTVIHSLQTILIVPKFGLRIGLAGEYYTLFLIELSILLFPCIHETNKNILN
jgi:hypothetical protein